MQNIKLAHQKSLGPDKLHGVKGKAAKGALELKHDSPFTRAIGFHLNNKEWYMTAFVEGQHPSNAQVTAMGKKCIELRDQFLEARTNVNNSNV